jgi:hypothetical protein
MAVAAGVTAQPTAEQPAGDPLLWDVPQVVRWLYSQGFAAYAPVFEEHRVDGAALLRVQEEDLHRVLRVSVLGDLKHLSLAIDRLRVVPEVDPGQADSEPWLDSAAKLLFSFGYLGVALVMTAIVMTLVHERVPDPQAYPPLPDIFLDNIRYIHGAFELPEAVIMLLLALFLGVLLLHQHRLRILRRFSVICASVFLLRCATMFATALSVPGRHVTCDVKELGSHAEKLRHVGRLISGFGMSINGVRTCGDYMFSGHTAFMTLFSFFITEYSPYSFKGLHAVVRGLNWVGMFLVLAAHEHYTIDVFIAYLVASRLFLYYHSICNNSSPVDQQRNKRQRGFFPFIGYMEEFTRGPLANAYELPLASWFHAIFSAVRWVVSRSYVSQLSRLFGRASSHGPKGRGPPPQRQKPHSPQQARRAQP